MFGEKSAADYAGYNSMLSKRTEPGYNVRLMKRPSPGYNIRKKLIFLPILSSSHLSSRLMKLEDEVGNNYKARLMRRSFTDYNKRLMKRSH